VNVAGMGEMINIYISFREETKRMTGRWEDNIKMGVMEMGCEVVDGIHLAQDRDLKCIKM